MLRACGEPLAEADAAWRRSSEALSNMQLGWRKAKARTAELEELTRSLDGEALRAFQRGRLGRIDAELRERNREAVGLLKRYLDAGPETQAQLRSLFPDAQSHEEFLRVLRTESNLDSVVDVYRALARPLAAGVGAGSAYSLFSG